VVRLAARRLQDLTRTALIIGYGNSLRGDDGIGPAVARAFAEQDAGDGARAIACHQLTPELAECIAAVDLVVFVDAAVDLDAGTVQLRAVTDVSAPSCGLMHTATPAALLRLAAEIYGQSPQAFLVAVGVSSLALGEVFSHAAATALPVAVAAISRLVSERLAVQGSVESSTDPSASTNCISTP
jgi:hydrogenase maturation protease